MSEPVTRAQWASTFGRQGAEASASTRRRTARHRARAVAREALVDYVIDPTLAANLLALLDAGALDGWIFRMYDLAYTRGGSARRMADHAQRKAAATTKGSPV